MYCPGDIIGPGVRVPDNAGNPSYGPGAEPTVLSASEKELYEMAAFAVGKSCVFTFPVGVSCCRVNCPPNPNVVFSSCVHRRPQLSVASGTMKSWLVFCWVPLF